MSHLTDIHYCQRPPPPTTGILEDFTPVPSPSASPSASPPPPPPPLLAFQQRRDRTSFSSVKENDCGIAQTFSDTKESSLAIEEISGFIPRNEDDIMAAAAIMATQQPPGFCCPCGRFKGWKQIRLSSRGLSKSSSSNDLRLLGGDKHQGWDWEHSPERVPAEVPKKTESTRYAPGQSPLERLPVEILDEILPLLASDVPTNGYTTRNADLMSCLLTSRTLHAATLTTLYKHVTIPHSLIFSKFLSHVAQYPALGTVVRRLDFTHFTSVGLGRTRRMNTEIQMLTADTLLHCLELTPRLQEFLVQEHLEDDLGERVMNKLFCDSPQLRALDFCASASETFRHAFTSVIDPSNAAFPASLNLKRLSLHECATLPASAFETLLPRLPQLSHLDVSRTQITDRALFSIPKSARLTHLNLSRCTRLSGQNTVDFLTAHDAAKGSLVYLNLLSDLSRYRLLSHPDVDHLLPKLSASLRALNLSGAKITSTHMPYLLPLTKHLEELSVGYSELSLDDVNSFFLPKASAGEHGSISVEEANWVPPTLHYLDLTGVASITQGVLFSSSCVLLRPATQPLEVLEISEKVKTGLAASPALSRRSGWVVRECGRRAWYVRQQNNVPAAERDSGRRGWKMGAMWWGMRKVPVAWGEVGGLYGHYMFKK
ncbi:MAG: hypothetical protein M1825_002536 [Sarcosagium campestre]|nr:MAG: hypothetical protein M1825_002536 [Sarcosagium campestre]